MWNNPLQLLPVNSATVYIRVGTNYGNPFLAVYTSSTQLFVGVTSGLVVPAYMVARWKA